VVERRLAQAHMVGLSWSGKGHYRFFGICNGRSADHHRSSRICLPVEEIEAGSSLICDGRARIIAGSVDICSGREIITGVEIEDLLWSGKGCCRFETYL
jgi:hypothetical protein